MKNNNISILSRISLILAAVFLVISIFVPIWKIELMAPQYPEGLLMYINANSLTGDVNIINGLNHYIGMKTLHAEEFVEFTVLPYLIGFFALATLMTAIVGKKKPLYILMTAFILFGILAMVDFWRWEYDYGHDLDPTAAIVVPGMAYQPPLIGFKQLLNFGAYSVPAIGGWLFIISGILMLISTVIESERFKKMNLFKTKGTALLSILMVFFMSCTSNSPDPIKLNQESCEYCKMRITNGHLGAELQTKKGRVYKFDDLSCMIKFIKVNSSTEVGNIYVNDYEAENNLILVNSAFFVHNERIESPMGGNLAAFKSQQAATSYLQKYKGELKKWVELIQ